MTYKPLLLSLLILFCWSLKIHQKNLHQNRAQKIKNKHYYYNIEQTNRVSDSRSIKYLNKCKDICLEMNQIFPFQFKYHRLVYRQPDGMMKYITGECLFAFRDDSRKIDRNQTTFQKQNKSIENKKQPLKQRKWSPWSQLSNFIELSTVQDSQSIEQKKAFKAYTKDCQDQQLKLSQSSRIDFKFILIHSDFEYYQNQGFNNLSPFDDLDQLFSGLQLPGI